MNATDRFVYRLSHALASANRDNRYSGVLLSFRFVRLLQSLRQKSALPSDIPLPPNPQPTPGLKLRVSGIAQLLSSLIIVDAAGQYKESYGTVDAGTLFEIPEGCTEIILCVDTLRGIPPDVRIEVLETSNGVQVPVAEFDKKRLDNFFKVHKQHALHPTQPGLEAENELHFKWGAYRTRDKFLQDLDMADSEGFLFEATPSVQNIFKDHRFIQCRRNLHGGRRYRALRPQSWAIDPLTALYMSRIYRVLRRDFQTDNPIASPNVSYIEDQAVSMITSSLDDCQITILATDRIEKYEIDGVRSHKNVLTGRRTKKIASVKCFLDAEFMLGTARNMVKSSIMAAEFCTEHVHDARALFVAKMVLSQQQTVLYELSIALDDIELSQCNEREFLHILPQWSSVFPDWRNHLLHSDTHLGYLGRVLKEQRQRSTSPAEVEKAIELAERLRAEAIACRNRLEMTAQVISIGTGFITADRSLQEADSVAKLSHLAFFFVPLGLVASLFSMDMAQFQGQDIRVWAIASVATLIIAYLFRIMGTMYMMSIYDFLPDAVVDFISLIFSTLLIPLNRWNDLNRPRRGLRYRESPV